MQWAKGVHRLMKVLIQTTTTPLSHLQDDGLPPCYSKGLKKRWRTHPPDEVLAALEVHMQYHNLFAASVAWVRQTIL